MTQLTDADYEIDMETLMSSMGIEPGTVAADTAKVQFINGKAVLTYTAMRAIPTRVLGVALLRSAAIPETDSPDSPVSDVQEPPRPVVHTRTAKPAKKAAK
jgi:hypothetical protein